LKFERPIQSSGGRSGPGLPLPEKGQRKKWGEGKSTEDKKSSQIKNEDEDYSDSFEDIQYEKEEGSV